MDVEIKTMDLSFCGEVAHNIVNKEAKEFILNHLKNKYNIGINDNRAFILNEKSVYFLEKTLLSFLYFVLIYVLKEMFLKSKNFLIFHPNSYFFLYIPMECQLF